jgi:hypothetical protein
MDPADAAQVHGEGAAVVSIAIVVIGIIVWERWRAGASTPTEASSTS